MPRKPRILVVDDDLMTLILVAQVLRAEGWDVETATNGHDGFLAVRAQTFDAMLLDVKMPIVDGTEMISLLKADKVECPKFIVMTAYGRAFAEDAFPGHPHILKPFTTEELLDAVRAHLGAA